MKCIQIVAALVLLSACWKPVDFREKERPMKKVWGNKPVYAAMNTAKQITFLVQKQPLHKAGNIYAIGNYIFQVDVGRGIHVIDNSDPVKADRIGFLTLNGCEQISIRGSYLYTNSFADLVTIDLSNPTRPIEISRVPNAFPEMAYNYPMAQPAETGYFTCPRTDSAVVGWIKDSIHATCFK
ncbi:hypothetical protein EXU57_06835 [Segetibacter sp. 3557_3]|uniref:hypothetical protein n=1 Tax=Segetibacter sp. 3557_3 TaxID=2547429 RepID=UPI0010588BE8|nr:hypothetical protein [Segetibacter sp. 3557_3]TDH27299.1 hypothetical protein EXU57_06835 [Segetibacter sp. 3557_3]